MGQVLHGSATTTHAVEPEVSGFWKTQLTKLGSSLVSRR